MYMPANQDIDFELPPEGSHRAVCYRVIDLGTQKQDWKGTTKLYRKLLISWELPDEKMEDGRPFAISQRYTFSSSEKARLRKDLESWRGKKFVPEDFGPGGFDIKNILGKGCLLNIVHNKSDDKTYANIAAIMAMPRGSEAPDLHNEAIYFSLESERFDKNMLENLSDNLRDTIKSSPEYRELVNGSDNPTEPPVSEEYDDRNPPPMDHIPF